MQGYFHFENTFLANKQIVKGYVSACVSNPDSSPFRQMKKPPSKALPDVIFPLFSKHFSRTIIAAAGSVV